MATSSFWGTESEAEGVKTDLFFGLGDGGVSTVISSSNVSDIVIVLVKERLLQSRQIFKEESEIKNVMIWLAYREKGRGVIIG